jgi:hypothetical protein
LDAIGADVVSDGDASRYEANRQRTAQTEALAADAAARLNGPVALVRPTYVGFPDEASESPNSLRWMVVTSQPTQFPWSYAPEADGIAWTGWGHTDRDVTVLTDRLATWLAQNQPGVTWTVIVQSH